jgi:hypothetical protein
MEMIEFSTKELISLGIAIISLSVNVIQWQKKKTFYKPIYNALVGLFNAIKAKQIYCYTMRKAVESGNYTQSDKQIRNNFSMFIQEILVDFEGIKEHLVAALKTMDKSDKEIFRASDFGLTEAEKKQREEFFKRGGAS